MNVGRRDMDHLVQEIKENLKLGGQEASTGSCGGGGVVVVGTAGGGKLKTKVRPSYSHRLTHRRTTTPYSVPPPCDSSSGVGVGGAGGGGGSDMRRKQRWGGRRRRYPSTCMNNNAKNVAAAADGVPDDPFAMLQELISDGSLIKEAVRRLQLDSSGRLGERSGAAAAAASGGKHTAYDSDDEDCRTPPEQIDLQFPCCQVGI